tara:strand:- start:592 stop:1104 length:513 start_codon:yes stop_codon:yes gene_type:complete
MKLYKNFLSQEDHKRICTMIWHRDFPWFNECLELGNDNKIVNSDKIESSQVWKQQHYLFTEYPQRFYSPFFHDIMMPLLGKLNFNTFKRIWANNYYRDKKPIKFDYHTDEDYSHLVAIYQLNTCNGYLEHDGGKVESVENSLILFDGTKKHRPVTQTDVPFRTNINIVLT